MSPSILERACLSACFAVAVLALWGCGDDGPTAPTGVSQGTFHVSAATGSDANPGTSASPFKTITHALAATDSDAVIVVGPGTYDTANGEVFPLVLAPGQTLVGDTLAKGGDGTGRINLVGHGATPNLPVGWIDEYATLVGAPRATVAGFRIGSTNQGGHFAIVSHAGELTVAHNTFVDPAYAGVYLRGAGRKVVRDNVFYNTSYGVYVHETTDSVLVRNNEFILPALPVDVVSLSDRIVVLGNWITGSGQVGVQVQGGSPLIAGNTFAKNGGYATYGAVRCSFDEATPRVRGNVFQVCALGVTVAAGNPDLGTAGDPGLNFFYVTGAAVRHEGASAILAVGNIWQHSPPTQGTDIVVAGPGSVRWGAGPDDVYP